MKVLTDVYSQVSFPLHLGQLQADILGTIPFTNPLLHPRFISGSDRLRYHQYVPLNHANKQHS